MNDQPESNNNVPQIGGTKKQVLLNALDDSPACCTPAPTGTTSDVIDGQVTSPAGEIPRVPASLTFTDRLGRWKARWGMGRMHYMITPGLYAVGRPGVSSDVFVTANYKMSFDFLRSELHGRDAWILVLDTKGINVWCAAGKGTFGTDEIVRRVELTRLKEIVTHRKLILPQLGGPGVRAHKVKDRTGFRVTYGPIRAGDLPEFLDNGMKVTDEMRRVHFTLKDRLVLIPVELVMSLGYLLGAAAVLFLLSGLGRDLFSLDRMLTVGTMTVLLGLGGHLAGVVLTPALLPWLPGRSFALKGAGAGLLVLIVGVLCFWRYPQFTPGGWDLAAWVLLIPAVASFIGMNFTGSSTYTSLSGVRREMRVAVPLQLGSAVLGLGIWIAARFV
jgi:acetyl-CoA decarbonylase/synthase complex subunit gamma